MLFEHKVLYNKNKFMSLLKEILNSKIVVKIIIDNQMLDELIAHQKEGEPLPKLKTTNPEGELYEEVEINSLLVAIQEILLAIPPFKIGDSPLVLNNPN